MNYKVLFLDSAKKDILNISEYLFSVTYDNYFSSKMYALFYTSWYSLSFLPYRCKIFFKDFRVLHIKKYKIFYKVDELKKEVHIYKVLSSYQNYQDFF